jgi:branched-chain amino acid transport system permease protein
MKAGLAWLPLFVLPFLVHNEVALTILIFTYILGILAVSFNLIFGYTGQLSLFHAAAFGIAAYVTQLSMAYLGVSFWIGMAIAVLAVSVLSVIVGTICFRFKLREFYFAIVTLAFSEMVRLVILNWNSVTNGSLGINLTSKPTLWLPTGKVITVESTMAWYYLSLVALLLTVLVCTRVVRSWMGRCFAAIRLNDQLADTLGINVFLYKLVSFLVGNAGAAVAGALYAFYLGYIEPGYLSIDQSLAIVAMALLGGRDSMAGPIIGAFILTALPHVINLGAEMRIMVYGFILMLTILLLPKGIVGLVARRRRGAPGLLAALVKPRDVL